MWPRQQATRIAKIKSLDGRRAALADIKDEKIRDLVAAHLKNMWQHKNLISKRHNKKP